MIFLYIVVLLFALAWCKKSEVEDVYLSKNQTMTVNGLFILLVFVGHALRYAFDANVFCGVDYKITRYFEWVLGQQVVVPFLFFSGYGVMESIKRDGIKYVKRMPTRRCLNTLINFDVAVIFFIVLSMILGDEFDVKRAVLSFVGWESYGNSNWYIFCIVICYALTAFTFRFFSGWGAAGVLFGLLCVYSGIMTYMHHYWWDTVFAYFYGVVFSMGKDRLTKFFTQHWHLIVCLAGAGWGCLMFLRWMIQHHGMMDELNVMDCSLYNGISILFITIIILLLQKVTICSGFLAWCGKNLFPLYIYQRLPMIVLGRTFGDWMCLHPIIFVLLSFVLTLPIVLAYRFWRVKLS